MRQIKSPMYLSYKKNSKGETGVGMQPAGRAWCAAQPNLFTPHAFPERFQSSGFNLKRFLQINSPFVL